MEIDGQVLTGSIATPLYANGQCATSHTFNNAPASCSGGGGGTDPTPTPPTCSWAGHCLGASCSTENDCSDALVCKSGKCANWDHYLCFLISNGRLLWWGLGETESQSNFMIDEWGFFFFLFSLFKSFDFFPPAVLGNALFWRGLLGI